MTVKMRGRRRVEVMLKLMAGRMAWPLSAIRVVQVVAAAGGRVRLHPMEEREVKIMLAMVGKDMTRGVMVASDAVRAARAGEK